MTVCVGVGGQRRVGTGGPSPEHADSRPAFANQSSHEMGALLFGDAQKTRFRGRPPRPHPARGTSPADGTATRTRLHTNEKHSSAEDGHRVGLGFGVAGGVGVGGRPSPEPCLLRAAEGARPHLVARSSAGKGWRVSVFRGGPPPHPRPGAKKKTEARE